jgi:hypothetical protein
MFYSISSLMYQYEHAYKDGYGLSLAEQRAEMVRAGETAAGLRDLRLRLGRLFRLGHRLHPAPGGGRGGRIGAVPAECPVRELAAPGGRRPIGQQGLPGGIGASSALRDEVSTPRRR